MRLGLVGWCSASGNGGMNLDIFCLADYVTKWLIPVHEEIFPVFDPYLVIARQQEGKSIYLSELSSSPSCINDFFEDIDGIIYVEHPVLRPNHFDGFCIVSECISRSKIVLGIPMWEWWPPESLWALNTTALWSVTQYTNIYLNSLVNDLESKGIVPRWKNRIFGNRWGVNIEQFPFRQRRKPQTIVFVNGNGGYKDRKAGDILIPILSKFSHKGVKKVIYSQKKLCLEIPPDTKLVNSTFETRNSVYESGDIFLFPSYWEGLCHGLYEAACTGGIVIATNTSPLNECLPAVLIPQEQIFSEKLDKKVKKVVPGLESLPLILSSILSSDCTFLSLESRKWVLENRDLKDTLEDLYRILAY